MTETKIEVPEWISMTWNSPEILVIGQTYAYQGMHRNAEGRNVYGIAPVTITGKAPRGREGVRVSCSYGLNRYQEGRYRGYYRADQYNTRITLKKNPSWEPPQPSVQLEFDF